MPISTPVPPISNVRTFSSTRADLDFFNARIDPTDSFNNKYKRVLSSTNKVHSRTCILINECRLIGSISSVPSFHRGPISNIPSLRREPESNVHSLLRRADLDSCCSFKEGKDYFFDPASSNSFDPASSNWNYRYSQYSSSYCYWKTRYCCCCCRRCCCCCCCCCRYCCCSLKAMLLACVIGISVGEDEWHECFKIG